MSQVMHAHFMFLNDLSDFCRSLKDTKKVSVVGKKRIVCISIPPSNVHVSFIEKSSLPPFPPFVQSVWTFLTPHSRPVLFLTCHCVVFHSWEATSPHVVRAGVIWRATFSPPLKPNHPQLVSHYVYQTASENRAEGKVKDRSRRRQ